MLLDTKQFVCNYKGELLHPQTASASAAAAAAAGARPLRLLVVPNLSVDRQGAAAAGVKGGWTGGKLKRRVDPPAELLCLQEGATVAELKRAATAALAEVYLIMQARAAALWKPGPACPRARPRPRLCLCPGARRSI